MNNQVYESIEKVFKAIPTEPPKFGPVFRGWIENDSLGYKLYLRITKRLLAGKYRTSVDFASVEVSPEKQRNGVFSALILACEHEADRRKGCVFVESILNTIIMEKLLKEGYSEVEGLPNCLFKDLSNVQACSPSNQ